jgi:sec-independent protein translocase protein TatA
MNRVISAIILLFSFLGNVTAFAPSPLLKNCGGIVSRTITTTTKAPVNAYQPASLQRQRKSVGQIQTMGLFGLGAPEIGVILVAAAFLLGPEKLASLGKDAGKIAGELKEVPKEFQAGIAEGEAQAKALKAKSEKEEEKKSAE